MHISEILKTGIPTINDYNKLLETALFGEMQDYNGQFLSKYGKTLGSYSNRWAADPFHQWSRQWEYPYVYYSLLEAIEGKNAFVLDAGSGCTFFPFYAATKQNWQIHCCDIDASLIPLFKLISDNEKAPVSFRLCDLDRLQYSNHIFDAVYCISVLEHVNNPERTVNELKKVLKNNGLFVLTFDVELTFAGLKKTRQIIGYLSDKFVPKDELSLDLEKILHDKTILTTTYFEKMNHARLPPTLQPSIKNTLWRILRLKSPKIHSLTIYGSTWKNQT